MSKWHKVIFISFFLISSLSLASQNGTEPEDCAPMRLDREGHAFESKIPVYSQDSLRTCWAYAAAQLVDFWRFTENPHASGNLSPIDVAFLMMLRNREDALLGNSVRAGVAQIQKYAACEQSDFLRSLSSTLSLSQGSERDWLQLLRYMEDTFEQETEKKKKESLSSRFIHFITGRDVKCCQGTDKTRDEPAENIYALLETSSALQAHSMRAIAQEVRQACVNTGRALSPKAPPLRSTNAGTHTDFKNIIHDRLSLNQPVSIAFCAQVLRPPSMGGRGRQNPPVAFTRGSEPRRRINVEKKDCDKHAALIIGRRKHDEHGCQLLLRNSWGTGCSYHQDWECERNDGALWIDERSLIWSADRIDHFQ
jgi:hypothetical protein